MENPSYPFVPPSSTCMSEDLLFFDTFSHPNSDKDNFDLVQFPSPVVIDLIKIVPLGQPVEAKIPGNVRLGATNPSNCELEFFINDLARHEAHTMTDLGKFHCSEKETDFNPPVQIQTDGLLLRGSYRTLTLAIFGQIVTYDEKPEEDQVIQSAASPPAQTPASPVASERDIPYIVRSVDQELIRQVRDDEGSLDESTMRSCYVMKEEPASPVENVEGMNEDDAIMDLVETNHIRDNIEDLSNCEAPNQAAFGKRDDDIDYSNSSDVDVRQQHPNRADKDCSSKEQASETCETMPSRHHADENSIDNDAKEWYFNLSTYSPKPLVYFADPSLTLQERTLLANEAKFNQESVDKEIEKVKEMFDALGSDDDYKSEEWVTLIEDLTNDISNMSLNQTINDGRMLEFLVEQVSMGLDMTMALKQRQTRFKVRHLKAGLKLATVLFHCGDSTVSALIQGGIVQKVLALYNQDQMSLPLRLLIFRCLSASCNTVLGVDHLINHQCDWSDTSDLVHKIQSSLDETNRADDEADNNVLLDSLKSKTLTSYQYMLLILMSQPSTRVSIAIGNLIKKIHLYQNLAQLAEISQVPEKEIASYESEDSVFGDDTDERSAETKRDRLDKSLQIVQELVNLMKNGCSDIGQSVRHLPVRTQFHVKPNPSDNYIAIYKWFKHFRTIDCLNTILITTRDKNLEMDQSVKFQAFCLAFIQTIVDAPRSIQLLLSKDCCQSTANLMKTLSQKVEKTRLSSHFRMSGIESLPDASFYREESLLAASCRDMSLKLCYNFKVFSCIDKLFDFHRELISEGSSSGGDTTSSSVPKSPTNSIVDPEKILHQLYIMTDHPYGLAAIMKHFSCIGNLDCILRFLDMPDYNKHLEFVRETLIDYVIELVGTFLRLNNNVLEISEEYLDTLLELCKTAKNKTLSVRIKSLLPWLNPFDLAQPLPLITYTEDTLRQLTRVIRKSIPDCSIPFAKGLDFELPPQMITAVRILRQLCIPPQVESYIETTFDTFSTHKLTTLGNAKTSTFLPFVDSLPHQQNHNQSWNLYPQMSQQNSPDDSIADQLNQLSSLSKLFQPYEESICGDLKYHYAIMQVFEQEGLKRLLNTLRELVGNYPRPIYQSAALSGLRGRIVISYIHGVITLLHSILCHLIDARGKEFRDTSIIPVVLETYSLLCFVPKPDNDKISELMRKDDLAALQKSITLRSDNYQMAQRTKKLILSILLSYTQMCLSVSESEENVISKSMWTKMLQEVVEFTLSAPVFFHHGLDVLTKILPAPLPCSSMFDTTDQEQLFKNINHRKLWSAHLHSLHQKIEQMISSLSLCCQSNIRTLLCYLCNQLCDLSSNVACMVAKIVTDTLISCTKKLSLDATGTSSIVGNISENQSTSVIDQQQNNPQQQQAARQSEDRTVSHVAALSGTNESKFAVKMIINLLTSLITNQAFEIAFTNHLQSLCKKDEKMLINLQTIIRSHDESKSTEMTNDNHQTNSGNSSGANSNNNNNNNNSNNNTNNNNNDNPSPVTLLIDSIRSLTESSVAKDNLTMNNSSISDVSPPDELTKINLIEMARKTSDRFNLTTGLSKTFRLKVLLDMNSRVHRLNESSSNLSAPNAASKRFDRPSNQGSFHDHQGPSSNYHSHQHSSQQHHHHNHHQNNSHHHNHPSAHHHPHHNQKIYSSSGGGGANGGSLRGRGRPAGLRPDSFRSRPQNTSRPPSIHVDDFNDLYRDNQSTPSGGGGGGRYAANKMSASDHYRSPSSNRGSYGDSHRQSSSSSAYFCPPPPSSGGRSQHPKAKYMKLMK